MCSALGTLDFPILDLILQMTTFTLDITYSVPWMDVFIGTILSACLPLTRSSGNRSRLHFLRDMSHDLYNLAAPSGLPI